MALNPCKECGTEVSTEAKACPKCGAPISKSKVAGGCLVLILLAAVFLIFVMVVGSNGRSSSDSSTNDQVIDQEIEKQADLCKNGHADACDTERELATLKHAAGR
jgi:hypothetical protein